MLRWRFAENGASVNVKFMLTSKVGYVGWRSGIAGGGDGDIGNGLRQHFPHMDCSSRRRNAFIWHLLWKSIRKPTAATSRQARRVWCQVYEVAERRHTTHYIVSLRVLKRASNANDFPGGWELRVKATKSVRKNKRLRHEFMDAIDRQAECSGESKTENIT